MKAQSIPEMETIFGIFGFITIPLRTRIREAILAGNW
jgi:hypothetical protein